MSEAKLKELWNFDDADLGANRLGQLTETQKNYLTGEHKSQSNVFFGVGGVVGAVIAIAFCCLPILLFGSRMVLPMLLSGNISDIQEIIPFAAGGIGIVAVVSVLVPIVAILAIYFVRGSKKADITVKRAEGAVKYTWGTKRVRTPGSSVRSYQDVRVLHLNMGDKKFEVKEQMQELIKEDENWIVYYTSYPFKFLSAEKI